MRESLNTVDAILQRRSTRHFDPSRQVSEEQLKQVLRLATQAPSGYNLQAWRFIVVRSERNRDRLRKCAYGLPALVEAPVVLIVLGYHFPDRHDLDPMLQEQIRRGSLTIEEGHALKTSVGRRLALTPEIPLWATRSAILATGFLLLAAEGLGLATHWTDVFDENKLQEDFGIPADHTPCGLIALGHPTEQAPDPGRFGLEHVCFEEHFGQPWTLGD